MKSKPSLDFWSRDYQNISQSGVTLLRINKKRKKEKGVETKYLASIGGDHEAHEFTGT